MSTPPTDAQGDDQAERAQAVVTQARREAQRRKVNNGPNVGTDVLYWFADLLEDTLAARPVPAATHTDLVPRHEAAYVTCDHCGAEAAPTQTGMTISCADCPPAAATHTDTAAQAGAQAVRDVLDRWRQVGCVDLDQDDPAATCHCELVDQIEEALDPRARTAHHDTGLLAVQDPAPTPGQRTVTEWGTLDRWYDDPEVQSYGTEEECPTGQDYARLDADRFGEHVVVMRREVTEWVESPERDA